MRFGASNVPPLGYRTFVPIGLPPPRLGEASAFGHGRAKTPDWRENAFFRLRLDAASGVVSSLIDKRSGRELVDRKLGAGLGQYVYERFDADDAARFVKSYCKYMADWVLNDFAKPGLAPASQVPHRTASPENFTLKVHRTFAADVAEMTAAASEKVPHAVTLRVTLPHDQPYVDFEWEIAGKKPDPWPEAGWLAFPLAIDQPTFRLGRLGSVVDPARDISRSANFETFCLNTGLNVLGRDGSGVGICPIDSPLVSLGRPGAYRYSRSFEPRKPVVLVNLFANLFGTNFQQWIGGSWSCRVRLWSVAGKDLADDLVTPAWEARCPLRSRLVRRPGRFAAAQPKRSGAVAAGRAGNDLRAQPGRRRHPAAALGAVGQGRPLPGPPAGLAPRLPRAALRPPRPAGRRADPAPRRLPRHPADPLRPRKRDPDPAESVAPGTVGCSRGITSA